MEADFQALDSVVQGGMPKTYAKQITPGLRAALERAVREGDAPPAGGRSLRPAVLDWSGIKHRNVASLGREVGETIDRIAKERGVAITRVVLPEGLTRIPSALSGMRELDRVDLASYQGEEIDLRELGPGGAPVEVHLQAAPELVRISRKPQHQVHLESGSHLMVKEWVEGSEGPDGKSSSRPAVNKLTDRFYARLDRNDHADGAEYLKDYQETVRLNLNGRAKLAGTDDPILCRHLAPAILYERLKWEEGSAGQPPRSGRFDYRKFSTKAGIQEVVGKDWEATLPNLVGECASNYLVPLPGLGKFLEDQFGGMATHESRNFLCRSGNHLMTLRLRVKPGPDGKNVRVIALQDPNATATHFRKVVTGAGPVTFDFGDALGPKGRQRVANYFGSDPAQQLALLHRVSLADFEAARKPSGDGDIYRPGRALISYLEESGPESLCTPKEILLRWQALIPQGLEERLVGTLSQPSSRKDRLDLLRGTLPGGGHVLDRAFNSGDGEWVRQVMRAAVRVNLPPEERMALLQGDPDVHGDYLLARVIPGRDAEGIDRYFESMRILGLDSTTLRGILMQPGREGLRPLDLALKRGPEATRSFVQGVLSLGLAEADILAILSPRQADGRTRLQVATEKEGREAVSEFLRSVLAANLGDRVTRAILLPEGTVLAFRSQLARNPGMGAVWRARLSESTQFALSRDLAAPAGPGPETERAARQRRVPYASAADLARLAAGPRPAELAQFTAWLHEVIRAPVPLRTKRELLTAADAGGRPLLHRLMAVNASRHVEVLVKAMSCVTVGDERLRLLESRAPRAGGGALVSGLAGGNQLAAEVWMRQVLATFEESRPPIPPAERRRILLGLPPNAWSRSQRLAVQAITADVNVSVFWAQSVARATDAQLDPGTKLALLRLVGMEHLLQAGDRKAPPAPASTSVG